jgi:hypothetical protein
MGKIKSKLSVANLIKNSNQGLGMEKHLESKLIIFEVLVKFVEY